MAKVFPMSKATTKSTGTGTENTSEMPFEVALKRLEAIVELSLIHI